ncbi:hypothetical protein GALMADRAFT_404923 [Galerina marginata CBS 339.88]|uniref:F-box domain-containing protein n=1 Tax=Galerina marginata (strain CBS 339.88) TaxID=685588 RepID=A0A067T4Z2_GALM3|nr:hypothetical protein GALMADRAFT_404923 [Galerina marginata CBS 339.88]
MALFPNLRSVRLNISSSKDRWRRRKPAPPSLARKAFAKYLYPQIDSVTVSRTAYPLLRSCPSVKIVNRMDLDCLMYGDTGFGMWVRGYCPRLEEFSIGPSDIEFEENLQAFSYLRVISLKFTGESYFSFSETFKVLATMKHLQKITLLPFSSIHQKNRQQILDWVVGILLELQKEDGEEKEVTMHFTDALPPSQSHHQKQPYVQTKRVHLPAPKT